MVRKKQKIASVHLAPVGNACFASGETGAAGYVKNRERQCAHVQMFANARGTALY